MSSQTAKVLSPEGVALPDDESDEKKRRVAKSSPYRTLKAHLVNPIERERRYLCPVPLAKDYLKSFQHSQTKITQSYFPRTIGEILIPLASELRILSSTFEDLHVTQARLRREDVPGRESQFNLTIKGKCRGLNPNERIELPIHISEGTYDTLLPLASEGTIIKERATVRLTDDEAPYSGHGPIPKLSLEIDLPHERVDQSGSSQDLRALNFALLEIETATQAIDRCLREGFHDVALLHRAIDISPDRAEMNRVRKLLSWSRLARKGVEDGKVEKALSTLL